MQRACFFTWKDVKHLFLRKKKIYIRFFLIVFVLFSLFRLITPPLYKTQSVFKQASQESHESDLVRSFLQNSGLSFKETGVLSILESRTLLKQVIQNLGLAVEEKESTSLFYTLKDKWLAEWGSALFDRKVFAFSDVLFEGPEPVDFGIRIRSQEEFELLYEGKVVAEGHFGVPIQRQGVTLTCTKIKEGVLQKVYPIRILPWEGVLKNVYAHLKIKPSKKDKNVLLLAFAYPDRQKAAAFLNDLMGSYQDYLKKENEELSKTQMNYLEKRQKELLQTYKSSLEDHASFLAKSLKDTGFLSFKQEIALLEKPNEDYLDKLYDVDLKLSRLSPKEGGPFQRILQEKEGQKGQIQMDIQRVGLQEPLPRVSEPEGLSPEVVDRLCVSYREECSALYVTLEELSHIQKKMEDSDFEVTSLGGILTDPVSREILQKASQIAVSLQDMENHSAKDLQRIREALDGQKRFLSQHLEQMIAMYTMKASLLEEKISSLRRSSVRLLNIEKDLIQDQLGALQKRMETLPEKWKRENELMMQRDLSLGVVEGLTQLAESKNIHHQLFQVESKPIDWALIPYKASKEYMLVFSAIIALFASALYFSGHFMAFLSKGNAITEDSAKELNVTFCGFLQDRFSSNLYELPPSDKETLRRISQFVSFSSKTSSCLSIISKSFLLVEHIASLLHLKGVKVLIIECTPSFVRKERSIGLYDYLQEKGQIEIFSQKGFDRIFAGDYHPGFVELLERESFANLIAEKKSLYDVILLFSESKSCDCLLDPLKKVSNGFVIHEEDVFYEKVCSYKPLAVVLSRCY